MVEQVSILLPHLRKRVALVHTHRRHFLPFAPLPVAAILRDLPNVDFRVKIRGKGVAMITRIGVQNIDRLNLIK